MENFLQNCRALFDWIKSCAQEMDYDVEVLKLALNKMLEQQLLKIMVPQEYGGLGFNTQQLFIFHEHLTRYSGALAFLVQQHYGACQILNLSSNEKLKAEYMRKIANNEILMGISFSHLRRPGKPLLTATLENGCYYLRGRTTWFSGWQIFNHTIIAATLPDGNAVYLMLPLNQPNIRANTLQLIGMNSINTVELILDNVRISQENEVFIKPVDWIDTSINKKITVYSRFNLGCAQAAVDLLYEIYDRKPITEIKTLADNLHMTLADLRHTFHAFMNDEITLSETEIHHLQANMILIANRCAHAALIASAGQGNLWNKPAQRIYREAAIFNVIGQNQTMLSNVLNLMLMTK